MKALWTPWLDGVHPAIAEAFPAYPLTAGNCWWLLTCMLTASNGCRARASWI